MCIRDSHNTIKLATNASNANSGTAINITGTGTGTAHTLSVAFDGVNKKFVATYDGGTKAQMTRANCSYHIMVSFKDHMIHQILQMDMVLMLVQS